MALAGARALGIAGLSVTTPHKDAAAAAVDRCDRAAAELGASAVAVDVRDEEDCARLVATHLEAHGGLDVLVNSAGVGIAGRIGDSGGNIIEVVHQRLFDSPSVQAADLELMVEARDPSHADAIVASLASSYTVSRI